MLEKFPSLFVAREFGKVLARKPVKYSPLVAGMAFLGPVFLFPNGKPLSLERFVRSSLLNGVYSYFRHADDIADRDINHPDPVSFLEGQIEFAQTLQSPIGPHEHLLVRCFEQGGRLGFDIGEKVNLMLNYLLFDAERYGTNQVLTQAELDDHYDGLDIRGCVILALKIFDEDPQDYAKLVPLARASRVQYTLRDFSDDVDKGQINISQEDMRDFEISQEELRSGSTGIEAWFRREANRGLELLDTHRTVIEENNFRFITVNYLALQYVTSAKKEFERVLNT